MNIKDIITESQHSCPHCGGPVVEYSELGEGKKDACYYKVKASAKVWPSAYASGRLVQCRKKGAANYGNKSEGVAEGLTEYKNTPLQDYNGLQFMIDSNHPYLRVKAFAPGSGQQLAQVDFKIDDQDELHPEDLHVEERWRGQGIAKVMYDYVKSQGYTIHRSWSQTDAGSEFWNKHRGQKRVWEQGVAEGKEKNHWYDAGVKDATRGARPNPRTYLPTLKDKQAKHPEEVDFYMNGYKSVPQGVAENFADGKNPQDKGDSKRHGINTKASVSSLRKTAKQGGRKGQLAHWLANMKAGRAKNESVAENSKPEMLFYAKLPSGQKVYARVKDEEQLVDLQQQYRGAEIKTFDYSRPDVIKWLQARGVNLSKFVPGMVKTVYDVMEAAHTANFNDDDWYEINPDTKTIVSQRGPQAYQVPFGQRQIDLPNGNIVVRGMRAKGMGLDTGLDTPQQNEDGTWGAL